MSDVEILENKLKEKGYKLTNQRKAIIEVLFEQKGRFLTAEDIFIKTREKHADTNFSTVYRNLNILEDTGIIHLTKLNSDASVYELADTDSHHHHIICRGCGKTESIDFCPLEELNTKLNNKNFTLTDHKFELYGYCRECEKINKK
ncbi:zinc-specific metallo-regulatory protein [Oxobacter pfennigii]|uniref:Zinc-specific metallo-regulatory protein n=1 Tax=Oxobacter pfennigii TaxID=36849 RepID=A0A0P8WBY8_9CLOT|nr:Fur family transcriptional regulator [Oxobacter pfennigii]KPU45425.1 zinc-specific metallo-regulatory protein [Oxobacter pfennigii]